MTIRQGGERGREQGGSDTIVFLSDTLHRDDDSTISISIFRFRRIGVTRDFHTRIETIVSINQMRAFVACRVLHRASIRTEVKN